MVSPQPAVSVSLHDLIGLNAYTKLVIPLVVDRLGAWEQNKSITPQEKKVLEELLASRGSRALHEQTFKVYPYGRTSREGGHVLLTHFRLTPKHTPRYHLKIHATRRDFNETLQLTSFLARASDFIHPVHVHRRAKLMAYDLSPGKTLDEILEQEKDPDQKEKLLTEVMGLYFNVARYDTRQIRFSSPDFIPRPLEPHPKFLTDHFLQRHDRSLRATSTQDLLTGFRELGDYLDSLPRVFCLNDLHGGNVLVERFLKYIDLSARCAHLGHGLVKVLSHPSITPDLEMKLLQKAKELAQDLPSHEELEKSYYLSQIVDDVLAMQRYLERAKTDKEERESWKQQALVAYNLALRRIETAQQKGYLNGKLNEKLNEFVVEHKMDVHNVEDEELAQIREHHHHPYGSVAMAMQETKGNNEPSAKSIRWGIRKPVWMRRVMWGAITALGLGLTGFGGYQVYQRQKDREQITQQVKVELERGNTQKLVEELFQSDFCSGFNTLVEAKLNGGIL
ncbi:MAG: hypothetical protein AABX70_04745, partial [Nanoarchaeota archaeon]